MMCCTACTATQQMTSSVLHCRRGCTVASQTALMCTAGDTVPLLLIQMR